MYYCSKWEGLAQFQNNVFIFAWALTTDKKKFTTTLAMKQFCIVYTCLCFKCMSVLLSIIFIHHNGIWYLLLRNIYMNASILRWVIAYTGLEPPFWFPDPLFGGQSRCLWMAKQNYNSMKALLTFQNMRSPNQFEFIFLFLGWLPLMPKIISLLCHLN